MEATDRQDWTALHRAANCGHVEVVKMLIDSGANIEATGSSQWTLLHWAAKNGRGDILRMLLQQGANKYGLKPLHFAAARDNVDIFKTLIEKGANNGASTIDRLTPMSGGRANEEAIPLDLWRTMYWATNSGGDQVVRRLLQDGANTEATISDGQTPLQSAANGGHVKIVKMLIEKGGQHRGCKSK